jgi:hypothetical protein
MTYDGIGKTSMTWRLVCGTFVQSHNAKWCVPIQQITARAFSVCQDEQSIMYRLHTCTGGTLTGTTKLSNKVRASMDLLIGRLVHTKSAGDSFKLGLSSLNVCNKLSVTGVDPLVIAGNLLSACLGTQLTATWSNTW